ncbi:MAG: hypothetical protein JSS32_06485 [Verrucomicrobia bacterium]|nr:hypothetical protein [Verrucomicrobiota bacterium]
MTQGIAQYLLGGPMYALDYANSTLDDFAPTTVVAATALGCLALSKLYSRYQQGGAKALLARTLMHIPAVQKEYRQKILKEFAKFKEEIETAWKPFGQPFLEIPEEGMPAEELLKLVQKYYETTIEHLKKSQVSGTVYQDALKEPTPLPDLSKIRWGKTKMEQLEQILTFAFQRTHLFNSLHTKEFPLGSFLKYQVVQMISEYYGGRSNEVMGMVTTGGSESLMTAIRAYRDYCKETKGHKIGETVILAPDTIHAAVLKAESAYNVKVVLIPTDKMGVMDEGAMEAALKNHGSKVGAIFLSAPCYKTGIVDKNIGKWAAKALELGIGCHVDCCLGAFVYLAKLLAIKGVTSASFDTHKNGRSPKGSSVVEFNEMPNGENLYYYAVFSLPNWSGGIYGTPNSAGSEPCTHVLHAFLTMLFLGKNWYHKQAVKIRTAANDFANVIQKIPGLQLLVQPEQNVVAFEINPMTKFRKGAIYQFAKEMEKRGFTFNAMLDESLHFCVTDRFVNTKQATKKLREAAEESMVEVQRLNDTGAPFPGAKMYCSMSEALAPDPKTQSWKEYMANWLFGAQAAHELVKRYYCTLINPNAPWKTVVEKPR